MREMCEYMKSDRSEEMIYPSGGERKMRLYRVYNCTNTVVVKRMAQVTVPAVFLLNRSCSFPRLDSNDIFESWSFSWTFPSLIWKRWSLENAIGPTL